MKEYTWDDVIREVRKAKFDMDLYDYQIVLFGAGMSGEFAYEIFKNKSNTIYYCDNNESLYNKNLNDIEIIHPNEITKLSKPFVIITTGPQHYSSISERLNLLKIEFITRFNYEVLVIMKC